MIEETYDQSRLDIVPEPKFVYEEHVLFERMLEDVAAKQEADRVVLSPTALSVLQSGVAGGGRFKVEKGDDHIGTIGALLVQIDTSFHESMPASLFKDDVEVGRVNVAGSNIRFI